MTEESLLDFCETLVLLFGVATQRVEAELDFQPTTIELRFHHRVALCGRSEDALLASLVRLIRLLRHDRFTPVSVSLCHPCPSSGHLPYTAAFGIAPQFDSRYSTLVFTAEDAGRELDGACSELSALTGTVGRYYLERLHSSSIVDTGRHAVVQLLAEGRCCRASIARKLGMSESTLRARLTSGGTTFNAVFDSARKALAIDLLTQAGAPVTTIAFDLGFTNAANFTRAFRRWTGNSPTAFRLGHQGSSGLPKART